VPPGKAQAFLWDATAKGLGLRVTPAGQPSYVFQSVYQGKDIRLTIGSPNAWSIPDAQAKARELQRQIDEGRDPREVKAAIVAADLQRRETERASSVTVGEAWDTYIEARKQFWGDRHYADHVALVKAGGVVKARGTKGRGVTLPGLIHPLLGIELRSLTTASIEAWAAKEAKTRPTSARLAWRCLKAFLSWCAEQPEYAPVMPANNPAKTKKTREVLGKAGVKQDALLREQLPAWFAAVRDIDNQVISAYLQTMVLTGARPGEILDIRWKDINTQWRGITIRDKVEGERVIPLTPFVSQLLAALPKRNEWVFSSTRTVSMDAKHEKRRARYHAARGQKAPSAEIEQASVSGKISLPRSPHVCACKVAGIDGLTLHGLRRSFKSLTEWLEIPAGVVAQIMGHKPSATAEKHYTVRPLDLLRVHHERIEAWILTQAGIAFDAKAQQAPGTLTAIQGGKA